MTGRVLKSPREGWSPAASQRPVLECIPDSSQTSRQVRNRHFGRASLLPGFPISGLLRVGRRVSRRQNQTFQGCAFSLAISLLRENESRRDLPPALLNELSGSCEGSVSLAAQEGRDIENG